ncbi:hypothetical protein FNV43_RR07257 [Rhamnella rubrinervis]|uniref:Retrotransposon gag domain-containing protein n=1 Tax=Rhamnella rubrinervis TaxID=2594499 RepID=A0A8K0HF03_9ROSA|nr:hypothetical protein FNV43_RR07257 [Rhamnella rubrinervis]
MSISPKERTASHTTSERALLHLREDRARRIWQGEEGEPRLVGTMDETPLQDEITSVRSSLKGPNLLFHRLRHTAGFFYATGPAFSRPNSHTNDRWKDPDDLFRVQQQKGESLRDYIQRFNDMKVEIMDCPDVVACNAFKRGLLPGPTLWFWRRNASTHNEALRKGRIIRLEEKNTELIPPPGLEIIGLQNILGDKEMACVGKVRTWNNSRGPVAAASKFGSKKKDNSNGVFSTAKGTRESENAEHSNEKLKNCWRRYPAFVEHPENGTPKHDLPPRSRVGSNHDAGNQLKRILVDNGSSATSSSSRLCNKWEFIVRYPTYRSNIGSVRQSGSSPNPNQIINEEIAAVKMVSKEVQDGLARQRSYAARIENAGYLSKVNVDVRINWLHNGGLHRRRRSSLSEQTIISKDLAKPLMYWDKIE